MPVQGVFGFDSEFIALHVIGEASQPTIVTLLEESTRRSNFADT